MTISQTTTRKDYIASAGQDEFAYDWKIIVATDIAVVKNNVLLSASDYSVSNVGVVTGGNVTLNSAASANDKVSLFLNMPITRTTNYANSGQFLASTVNDDFDKVYSAAVQNSNTRFVALQNIDQPLLSGGAIDMSLPLGDARKGKLLGFNSTTANPEAVSYANATILNVDTFTGDGSTTAFTLSDSMAGPEYLNVAIDGVMQAVATYAVSGTTLTFTEAPPLNSGIEVRKYVGNITTLEGISGVTAGTNLNGGGTSGNVTVNVDASPSFTNVTATTVSSGQVDITAQGDLRLQDSSGGQYAALQAAATTTSYTLTLPAAVGSSGQVLQTTDGSGTLGFATVGGAYNEWAVKTTTYQLVNKDQIICNHASTPFTVTLPTANVAGGNVGNTVIIKNVGAATVTVARNSSPIDSAASDGTLPSGNAVQLVYVDDTIGWASL